MNGVANFTETIDGVFLFIGGISVFLFIAIIAIMFFFLYKYHYKRNPKATPIEGSLKLEIIWTITPIILVLIMFYVSYKGFEEMRDIPDDAIPVKVFGRMWNWTFEYENGMKTDTLYVPVGKPVAVYITSMDVNHSFYIPAFRLKTDAINGHVNTFWFEVNESGQYDVACAEYCGLDHAYMYTKVIAMENAKYEEWYTSNSSQGKVDEQK